MQSNLLKKIYIDTQIKSELEQAKREKRLQNIYLEANEHIYKKLKKHLGDRDLSNTAKTQLHRLSGIYKEISSIYKDSLEKTRYYLTNDELDTYKNAFLANSYTIYKNTDINVDFSLGSLYASKFSTENPLTLIKKGNAVAALEYTKDLNKIRKELTLGLVLGKSYDQIANAISPIVGKMQGYSTTGLFARALRISRTENHRALVAAQSDAYEQAKKAGVNLTYYWDAALDSRIRESHRNLHNVEMKEKGWYVKEIGMWVSAPGFSSVASFDINCRCRIRAHLIEDKDIKENKVDINDFAKRIKRATPIKFYSDERKAKNEIMAQAIKENINRVLMDEENYKKYDLELSNAMRKMQKRIITRQGDMRVKLIEEGWAAPTYFDKKKNVIILNTFQKNQADLVLNNEKVLTGEEFINKLSWTLLHEATHLVDNKSNFKYNPASYFSREKGLLKVLKSDGEKIIRRFIKEEYKEKVKDLENYLDLETLFKGKDEEYIIGKFKEFYYGVDLENFQNWLLKNFFQKGTELTKDDFIIIDDIISSITLNQLTLFQGHNPKYWLSDFKGKLTLDRPRLATESFANFSASLLTNPKAIEYARNLLPNFYKSIIIFIREVI